MNKRIDFTNLGGFPLEQDTLEFMQSSYRGAISALAQLTGNKVIVKGVETIGTNVTDGWIVVDGELIPFVGGNLAANVVLVDAPNVVRTTFEDGFVRDVYYTKTATCGLVGNFAFSELVPLLTLQNMWVPGDLKQKHVDNAYIASNFDGNGYGLNREKGWRILSSAYPAAAGRVLVNLDAGDADFDEVGKLKGAKTHTLTISEMPAHNHAVQEYAGTNSSGQHITSPVVGTASGTLSGSAGGGGAHNNIQPSYVVLTLIKL